MQNTSKNARFAKTLSLSLSLSLGLLSACSDTGTTGDTADMAQSPGGDMGTSGGGDMASGPPRPTLVVAGSDFNTGALSTVDVATMAVQKNIDVIDKQPVIRAFGTKVYVLDQTRGSLRTYDATKNFQSPVDSPATKSPDVPGAQANPHDIYVDGPRNVAYVTLYGGFGSTAVTGATALGVIDLTQPQNGIKSFISLPVAGLDTDNNPDADRVIGCGDYLYVLLQNVDRNKSYRAAGGGTLYRLTLATMSQPRSIPLTGQNPVSMTILPDCSEAIVGSAGDQLAGTLTGMSGVERVDLNTASSLGLALTDMQLGGNVSALDAVDRTKVFVDVSVKSGTTFNNTVYVTDVVQKTKGAAVLGPMNYVAGVRVLADQLVVLSAGTPGTGQLKTGLYMGAASGQALPTMPLDVGLPPQSVALVSK